MNILTTEKRVAVVSCLVEGCSIRSTVRLTGVAKDTVLKLLAQVGEALLGVSGRRASEPALQAAGAGRNLVLLLRQGQEPARTHAGHAGRRRIWTWTAT